MDIAKKIRQTQNKDGMLKRSLERLIQLYTDKSHFVYELLQNAEDAQATHICFTQYCDRLEVMHDGIPFTEKNLEGLCDIGKSDKIGNLNQIGEFGVGFKSVFGICETVKLYSSPGKYKDKVHYPFAVEIRDFTEPVNLEPEEFEKEFTTKFVFPYQVGRPFSGFKNFDDLNEVLSQRLTDLGYTTLLFMKNLNLIEYEIKIKGKEKKGKYRLNKNEWDYGCTMITAVDEEQAKKRDSKKEELFFLKFSKAIDSTVSNQSIDIAFAATIDKNNNIKFTKAQNPYISVYFPTETESKLDFIIQGPFRTTPNRSSVPADDEDNKQLAEKAGNLLVESVVSLGRMGLMNADLLNILPIQKERFNVYPLFKPLFTKLVRLFRNNRILPTNLKDVYIDANHALIARNNALMELFPNNVISQLFGDGNNYEWMPEEVKETGQYMRVHAYMIKELKIKSIRPEDLKEYFVRNPAFLQSKTRFFLIRMYKLYNTIPNVFMPNNKSNMIEAPIVLTKDERLVPAYHKIDDEYHANVFLPVSKNYLYGLDYVDPDVYKECEEFFRYTLRLKAPDEYSYFVRSLHNHYDPNNFNVTFKDHTADIKQILKYLHDEQRRQGMVEHLKDCFCLKCHKRGKVSWVSPYKFEVMFPVDQDGIRIEDYFKGVNESFYYVDINDYLTEGITYSDLKELNVSDKIIINDEILSGAHELGKNTPVSFTWNTNASDLKWKLSLQNIASVLKYISSHPDDNNSILKSQTIYKTLLANQANLSGMLNIFRNGSLYSQEKETSLIIKILVHESGETSVSGWKGKWLYDNNNHLVSQFDISKYDLNSAVYGDVDKETNLYELLGFYKNDQELQDEAEKQYDQFTADQKDSIFEIELQRRFGMTVNELKSQLKNRQTIYKTDYISDDYEFPVHNVGDWRSLRKHVAQSLYYADAVTYAIVQRSIRVSKKDDDRAYLSNMYGLPYSKKYACQMCHKPSGSFHSTQIEAKPDLELDQMHLCLCPNCSDEFKKLKNDKYQINRFLEQLLSLTDFDIENNDNVEISIGNKKVWFTQTHAAEVSELLKLKKQVRNQSDKNDSKETRIISDEFQSQPAIANVSMQTKSQNNTDMNDSSQVMIPIKSFNDSLIGQNVYLRVENCQAKVVKIDPFKVYLSIPGEKGSKRIIYYYISECIKKDFVLMLK